MPDCHLGSLYAAYALHELKRTSEAREVLLKVAGRFPKVCQLHYNLAVYCTQLGMMKEAKVRLERAMDLDPKIKKAAREDGCLEKFWEHENA